MQHRAGSPLAGNPSAFRNVEHCRDPKYSFGPLESLTGICGALTLIVLLRIAETPLLLKVWMAQDTRQQSVEL